MRRACNCATSIKEVRAIQSNDSSGQARHYSTPSRIRRTSRLAPKSTLYAAFSDVRCTALATYIVTLF